MEPSTYLDVLPMGLQEIAQNAVNHSGSARSLHGE